MDTYNILVLLWIGIACIVALLLLKIPAPYGRYTKRGWGFIVDNRLAWFLMESPSLIIPLYWVSYVFKWNINKVSGVFTFMWIFHYFYRALIFPLLLKSKRGMPISVVLMGLLFNVVNSILNMYYFLYRANYPDQWFRDFRFLVGSSFFVIGFIVHFTSDWILRNLRNGNEGIYLIPRGWLFEYVSCPNYLGEIIEWIGFAVASWSLSALSFAVWTGANLIPRALSHHMWYRKNFIGYPEKRRALVPYLL